MGVDVQADGEFHHVGAIVIGDRTCTDDGLVAGQGSVSCLQVQAPATDGACIRPGLRPEESSTGCEVIHLEDVVPISGREPAAIVVFVEFVEGADGHAKTEGAAVEVTFAIAPDLTVVVAETTHQRWAHVVGEVGRLALNDFCFARSRVQDGTPRETPFIARAIENTQRPLPGGRAMKCIVKIQSDVMSGVKPLIGQCSTDEL